MRSVHGAGVRVIGYRLYLVDKEGHILGPAQEVHCPDDEAVLTRARKLVDGHDIEVWRDNQRVGIIPSKD